MAYVQGRVQDSESGVGLNSTLTDNLGNLGATDTQGFWYTTLAYPGYRLTAGAYAHLAETHEFTAEDINAGWITIRLDRADVPTSDGPDW